MKISIIVPVRNEESSIRELLTSLCTQTRLPDEIVITDGGSTDRTAEIIDEYDTGGISLVLLREKQAFPGRGRNLAAARASAEWLAFVDAGVKPERDWLENMEKIVSDNPGLDVVYGAWEPVTNSFFKECAAIAYVPAPTVVDGQLVRPRFIASSLIRRSAWKSVGGFPESLRSAEDLLFMNELVRVNAQTAFTSGALVRWNIQPGLWSTFRRFTTYSRHNIRAGLWRQWQMVILRRYLFLLVIAAVALFFGWKWLSIPVGLMLSMFAARGLISIYRNRKTYPAGAGKTVLRILLLVPLFALLDAAAILGATHWLVRDKLGQSGWSGGAKHGI